MNNEVTPLQINSVLVKQDEEAIEQASVTAIAEITVVFDRDPYAFEKSEIESYFDHRNNHEEVVGDPSFSRNKMTFRTDDPNVANSIVGHVTTQAKNLAEGTQERRTVAAEMLSDLEKELQPPRGEKDLRPVEG